MWDVEEVFTFSIGDFLLAQSTIISAKSSVNERIDSPETQI